MAQFRVKITGFKKFEKEQIIKVNKISDVQVGEVAKQTEKLIRTNINSSLVRPGSTGKLASNFFAERVTRGCWGVGNIPVLNANVPYWRHVNFGSLAIGADFAHRVPTGIFTPGIANPSSSAFRSGRWNPGGVDGNGAGFSFIPGKPIEPHNFIQRTLAEIPRVINLTLRTTSKGF